MLVEKVQHSGAYVISALDGETRRYYGYTKREAVADYFSEFPHVRETAPKELLKLAPVEQ